MQRLATLMLPMMMECRRRRLFSDPKVGSAPRAALPRTSHQWVVAALLMGLMRFCWPASLPLMVLTALSAASGWRHLRVVQLMEQTMPSLHLLWRVLELNGRWMCPRAGMHLRNHLAAPCKLQHCHSQSRCWQEALPLAAYLRRQRRDYQARRWQEAQLAASAYYARLMGSPFSRNSYLAPRAHQFQAQLLDPGVHQLNAVMAPASQTLAALKTTKQHVVPGVLPVPPLSGAAGLLLLAPRGARKLQSQALAAHVPQEAVAAPGRPRRRGAAL